MPMTKPGAFDSKGAWDGYNIIPAVMNVVKYRKYNRPVMSAALVSMLSLETAMLAQFDNGKNPETFRRVMTGSTEGCVCVIVLGIAIYMVIRSTKQIRKLAALQKRGTR